MSADVGTFVLGLPGTNSAWSSLMFRQMMCVLTKGGQLYSPSGLPQLFQPLVLQGADLARHTVGEEIKGSPMSRSGEHVKKHR